MKVYSVGNGQLHQMGMTEVCNTLDCMHDKQAIVCETEPSLPIVQNSSGGGYTETIDASYYKGVGSRGGKEREYVLIIWP